MFNFGKDVNPALQSRIAERQAAKQAARESKAQSRQQIRDEMLDAFATSHNIAVYFNQQCRDIKGYAVTIRQKDPAGAGSSVVYEPGKVTGEMISTIQQQKGLFIEGHMRNSHGLIKDVYDSAHPDGIYRERYGKTSILKTADLEKYEEKRLKPIRNIGPRTRVIAVDDLSDVGLTGYSDSCQMGD